MHSKTHIIRSAEIRNTKRETSTHTHISKPLCSHVAVEREYHSSFGRFSIVHFLSFLIYPRYSKNSFLWCWWCARICISHFIRNISYIALHFAASFVCSVCVLATRHTEIIVCSSLCMAWHTQYTTSFIRSVLVGYGFDVLLIRCSAFELCVHKFVRSPTFIIFIPCSQTSVLQLNRVLQIRFA